MLSGLRNTWVLLDTERLDERVLERLRPPLLPGLHQALEALAWCAADYEGRDGGRMSREEFLDEIEGQPWLRFEHHPQHDTSELESWFGDELLGGWSLSIREHFRLELPWKRPSAPCRTLDWSPSPDTSPFETVVSLFLLDDPYELHRLFVMAEHGFDPDLLGPLTIWKDIPDMLREFSDDYDSRVADLRVAVADRLDADFSAVAAVLDDWFANIAREGCDDFPALGHIRRVDLPDIQAPRPVSLNQHEPGPDVILHPPTVHAATALPPSNWLRSAPIRRRDVG